MRPKKVVSIYFARKFPTPKRTKSDKEYESLKRRAEARLAEIEESRIERESMEVGL